MQRTIENNHLKKIEFMLLILFIIWCVGSIFLGEHIPKKDGLGFDGSAYAYFAQDFNQLLFNHKFDTYLLHRILPSGIVSLFFTIGKFAPTTKNMVLFFSIYNTIVILFSFMIWHAIAKKLNWSQQIRCISFAGFFINFAILKMPTYYPTLTDTTAFLFGFLLMYFLILNKRSLILLATVCAAFVNLIFLYIGMLLFIFPEQKSPKIATQENLKTRANFFLTFMVTAITFTGIFIIYATANSIIVGNNYLFPIIIVSVMSLFSYLFLAFYPICNYYKYIYSILKNNISFYLLFGFVIFIALKFGFHFISSGLPNPFTPFMYLQEICVESLAYPFIYIISHIFYFGPMICLIIYYWRPIIAWIYNQSFGLFLVTIITVLLTVGSESRQFINFLPMLGIPAFDVLNKKQLSNRFVISFIFLCIIASRFWLPINQGPWDDIFLAFPMQWYFMNFGPFVSHSAFFVLLFAGLIISALVYLLIKTNISNQSISELNESKI